MPQSKLGTDLKLLNSDLTTTERAGRNDLAVVSGVDNLVQALNHRFMILKGGLRQLGHPVYGSKLDELIGRPNDETIRNLVRLYTLEVLRQEPRIKEIMDVKIIPKPEEDRVDIDIIVIPIDSDVPLNLVFPFYLEGS